VVFLLDPFFFFCNRSFHSVFLLPFVSPFGGEFVTAFVLYQDGVAVFSFFGQSTKGETNLDLHLLFVHFEIGRDVFNDGLTRGSFGPLLVFVDGRGDHLLVGGVLLLFGGFLGLGGFLLRGGRSFFRARLGR